MIATLSNFSTIGAFVLAGIIALIGYTQSKKKDTDRVYEYLEIMTNHKVELELALSDFVSNFVIEEFNKLNTKHSAFVNYLDYFSSKILNQKLYNNKAFEDFQGETCQALKEWAIFQLIIYELIESSKFNDFEIVDSATIRKRDLKYTYKLLRHTLDPNEYHELEQLRREKGLV
ncbi:hypothetical protein [Lysinibacillus fusiformis]|uniref:hypothetical protein n=1 Tax=Lysinibacillus fusiformis TaxID=28031 RepID=UPI00148D8F89|nr:hypothetical protein [Lysinibacillus fusiformis]NOG26581.1 hypothetical protein [Lysinibacillus fusiformis]